MWKVLCAFVLLLWGVRVPLFERDIKQGPEGRMMSWTGSRWLFFAPLCRRWLWSLFFIFSSFMENSIRQKKRQTSSRPCFRCLLKKCIIFWKEKCHFISKTKHELAWNYSVPFRWSKQLSATLHVSTHSSSLVLGGKSEVPLLQHCSALERRTQRFFLSSRCHVLFMLSFRYKDPDLESWELCEGTTVPFNLLSFPVPWSAPSSGHKYKHSEKWKAMVDKEMKSFGNQWGLYVTFKVHLTMIRMV